MSIIDSLYFLGIWSYRQVVRLAALFGHRKARLLNHGLKQSFRKLMRVDKPTNRFIWVHCASLGEFEQARPLIELIRRKRPELKIALTFYSPSGYEVRCDYEEAEVVAYLPFDTPENASLLTEILQPEKAIFVKYEFWPNYLKELKERGVETYLISGVFRPNQLFFKPYGGYYRKLLDNFTTLYVQDNGSRKLLEGIGIKNAVVAGDTRFDRVTDIMRGVKPHPVLDRFCGPARKAAATEDKERSGASKPDKPVTAEAPNKTSQPIQSGASQPIPSGASQPIQSGASQPIPSGASQPIPSGATQPNPSGASQSAQSGVGGDRPIVFMAGSSWPADEAVYAPWLKREKSVKGVIAPHEFDDERLKKLLDLFEGEAVLLSDAQHYPEEVDKYRILIIDCFGLLSSAYAYADIAYVGGGFGAGLHNINEAAVYGVPVIYGPNHSKFIEAEEMKTLGGGLAIDSETSFARIAGRLAHDPIERARRGKWAADYIQSKLGATRKIYSEIFAPKKKKKD